MDFADWMWKCRDIHHKKLLNITIPGTHNSCAYTLPFVSGTKMTWAKCHNLDLLQQMKMGVRHLDLRIRDQAGYVGGCCKAKSDPELKKWFKLQNPARFWTSHTWLAIPLQEALDQVLAFLGPGGHENEIVILAMKADGDLKDEAWPDLLELIQTTLGNLLIPEEAVLKCSIGEILRTRGRVVLMTDKNKKLDPNQLKLVTNIGRLDGSWGDSRTINPELLMRNLTKWISKKQEPAKSHEHYTMAQGELTPTAKMIVQNYTYCWVPGPHFTTVEDCAMGSNWALWQGLCVKGGMWSHLKVNCVTSDYTRPEIVGLTILRNYKRHADFYNYLGSIGYANFAEYLHQSIPDPSPLEALRHAASMKPEVEAVLCVLVWSAALKNDT
eukprot:Platyproteum_vivax@DN5538_c0_g2_i2.p1